MREPRYFCEYDEETGLCCVFDTHGSFIAKETYCSWKEAEDRTEQLNNEHEQAG